MVEEGPKRDDKERARIAQLARESEKMSPQRTRERAHELGVLGTLRPTAQAPDVVTEAAPKPPEPEREPLTDRIRDRFPLVEPMPFLPEESEVSEGIELPRAGYEEAFSAIYDTPVRRAITEAAEKRDPEEMVEIAKRTTLDNLSVEAVIDREWIGGAYDGIKRGIQLYTKGVSRGMSFDIEVPGEFKIEPETPIQDFIYNYGKGSGRLTWYMVLGEILGPVGNSAVRTTANLIRTPAPGLVPAGAKEFVQRVIPEVMGGALATGLNVAGVQTIEELFTAKREERPIDESIKNVTNALIWGAILGAAFRGIPAAIKEISRYTDVTGYFRQGYRELTNPQGKPAGTGVYVKRTQEPMVDYTKPVTEYRWVDTATRSFKRPVTTFPHTYMVDVPQIIQMKPNRQMASARLIWAARHGKDSNPYNAEIVSSIVDFNTMRVAMGKPPLFTQVMQPGVRGVRPLSEPSRPVTPTSPEPQLARPESMPGLFGGEAVREAPYQQPIMARAPTMRPADTVTQQILQRLGVAPPTSPQGGTRIAHPTDIAQEARVISEYRQQREQGIDHQTALADLEQRMPVVWRVIPQDQAEAEKLAGMAVEAPVEDRRRETALRHEVEQLTPEEKNEVIRDLRNMHFTDELTGLRNKAAYLADQKQPYQAVIDLDGLKWINDNIGHEAGDVLIQEFARELPEGSYHLSGDEFVVQASSREELDTVMSNLQARTSEKVLQFTSEGQTISKQGIEFSYGIGDTFERADIAMQQHKTNKLEMGERPARGEQPRGIVRTQETTPVEQITRPKIVEEQVIAPTREEALASIQSEFPQYSWMEDKDLDTIVSKLVNTAKKRFEQAQKAINTGRISKDETRAYAQSVYNVEDIIPNYIASQQIRAAENLQLAQRMAELGASVTEPIPTMEELMGVSAHQLPPTLDQVKALPEGTTIYDLDGKQHTVTRTSTFGDTATVTDTETGAERVIKRPDIRLSDPTVPISTPATAPASGISAPPTTPAEAPEVSPAVTETPTVESPAPPPAAGIRSGDTVHGRSGSFTVLEVKDNVAKVKDVEGNVQDINIKELKRFERVGKGGAKLQVSTKVLDTPWYQQISQTLEAVRENPYFSDLTIKVVNKHGQKHFTREELDELGYKHFEPGEYWWPAFHRPASTGKGWEITFNRGATKDTVAEEIVHHIEKTAPEKFPELNRQIEEWKSRVKIKAGEKGYNIPDDQELFAQAFVFSEMGYADVSPDLAELFSIPKSLRNKMEEILTTDAARGKVSLDVFLGAVKPSIPRKERGLYIHNLNNNAALREILKNTDYQLKRVVPGQIFYSKAFEVIQQKMPNKAPPQQILGILKSAGIKQEEMNWLGVEDWLQELKVKSVSKTDVLNFIAENTVRIDELVMGSMDPKEYRELEDSLHSHTNKLARDLKKRGYTAMGAIDLIEDAVETNDLLSINFLKRQLPVSSHAILDEALEITSKLNLDAKHEAYTIEGGMESYFNIVFSSPDVEDYKIDEVHFGEVLGGRNQLGWVRGSIRKNVKGERVLFIEEIQSKRHQLGRQYGYTDELPLDQEPPGRAALERERRMLQELSIETGEKLNTLYEQASNYIRSHLTEIEEMGITNASNQINYALEQLGTSVEYGNLQLQLHQINNRVEEVIVDILFIDSAESAVPPTPFKKYWELMFKRTLYEAARNDIDIVVWPTGEQISEVYGLHSPQLAEMYDNILVNFVNSYMKKWKGGKVYTENVLMHEFEELEYIGPEYSLADLTNLQGYLSTPGHWINMEMTELDKQSLHIIINRLVFRLADVELHDIARMQIQEAIMDHATPRLLELLEVSLHRIPPRSIDVHGVRIPENMKSPPPDFLKEQPLFQLKPVFRSKLQEFVNEKMPEKAPPQQIKGLLTSKNAKQYGVKEEEIKWSGIIPWLETYKGKVTKHEVLSELRKNEIKITEVEKTVDIEESKTEFINTLKSVYDTEIDKRLDMREKLTQQINQRSDDLRSRQDPSITYTTEEAVNMIMQADETLPKFDEIEEIEELRAHLDAIGDASGIENLNALVGDYLLGLWNAKMSIIEPYEYMVAENFSEDSYDRARTAWHIYTNWDDVDMLFLPVGAFGVTRYEGAPPRIDFLREDVQHLKHAESLFIWGDSSQLTEPYTTPHWDEENVLAHARYDIFNIPGHGKEMFVREMQSDWHQEGQRRGYREDLKEETKLGKEMNFAEKRVLNAQDEFIKEATAWPGLLIYNSAMDNEYPVDALAERYTPAAVLNALTSPEHYHLSLADGRPAHLENYNTFKEFKEAMEEYNKIATQYRKVAAAPPVAPLVKNWHEYTFKRLLHKAAEEDVIRISWAPGILQPSEGASGYYGNVVGTKKDPVYQSGSMFKWLQDSKGKGYLKQWGVNVEPVPLNRIGSEKYVSNITERISSIEYQKRTGVKNVLPYLPSIPVTQQMKDDVLGSGQYTFALRPVKPPQLKEIIDNNSEFNEKQRKELNKVLGQVKKINPKYMRPEYRDAVYDLMEEIEFAKIVKDPEKINRMRRMQQIQEALERESGADVHEELLEEVYKSAKKSYMNMDYNEILNTLHAILHLAKMNESANHFIIGGNLKEVSGKIDKSVKLMEESHRKTGGVNPDILDSGETDFRIPKIQKFLTVDSYMVNTMAEILSGVDNSPILEIMYDGIDRGYSKKYKALFEATDPISKKAQEIGINNILPWSTYFNKKRKHVDFQEISLKDGIQDVNTGKKLKTMKVSKGERMSFYLHTKNSRNKRNLIEGGFVLRHQPSKLYKITEQDLDTVVESMSKEERSMADEIFKQLNTTMKKYLNETSLNLVGYEIAMVENYFPIARPKDFVKKEHRKRPSTNFGYRILENMGVLKSRKQVIMPLFVDDAFFTFIQNIEASTSYIGLAEPIRNARIMMDNEKFAQAIRNRGLYHYYEAIERYLNDIEGEVTRRTELEQFGLDLLSRIQKAILGANVWIMFKQPVSYLLASEDIPIKYLSQALPKKLNLEEIRKYSPQGRLRLMGMMNRETGEIAEVGRELLYITGRKPWTDKFLTGIRGFDTVAVGKLWEAVKLYVKDTKPQLTGDDFFNEVAVTWERVVNNTQPTYLPHTRSNIGRERSMFVRGMTMFTTQRNKIFNMAVRGVNKYRNSGRTPKDKAKLVKTIMAILMGSLLIFGIDEARDRFYQRERKSRAQHALNYFVTNMSYIYIVGNMIDSVNSMIQRGPWGAYGFEDPATDLANETIQTAYSIINAMGDIVSQEEYQSGYKKDEKKWETSVVNALHRSLGIYTKYKGIPYQNIRTMALATIKQFSQQTAFDIESTYRNVTADSVYDDFWQHMETGNHDKAAETLTLLKKEFGTQFSNLESSARRREIPASQWKKAIKLYQGE